MTSKSFLPMDEDRGDKKKEESKVIRIIPKRAQDCGRTGNAHLTGQEGCTEEERHLEKAWQVYRLWGLDTGQCARQCLAREQDPTSCLSVLGQHREHL